MLALFLASAIAADVTGLAVRSDLSSHGGSVVAVVPIQAPPDRVLDVILDVEDRAHDVQDIRTGRIYAISRDAVYAEYNLAILGMSHWFHLRFDTDRGAGLVRFDLDPDPYVPNDVKGIVGSYLVTPTATGSLLTYTMSLDVGYFVPMFLRKRVVVDRATEEVQGIVRRAEKEAQGAAPLKDRT
jgi:hypothetical protein